MDNDIFTVKARRCKRCGGILISERAVAEGYGQVCKMRAVEEARFVEFQKRQVSMFGSPEQNNEKETI